jgi:hypothetical protein
LAKPRSFRRLSVIGDANANDVIVHIARAGGVPKARVMMPTAAGVDRSLEHFALDHAASLARAAAEKHDLGLVVVVAEKSGLSWQSEWNEFFGSP